MNELLRVLLFLPPQRSTMARDIDELHYSVILVTMAGAVAITLIGGYFLIRYRRRAQYEGVPHPGASSRPPLLLEASAIIALAIAFLGWWNIGVRQFMRLRVAPEESMEIYVTGKQWMWKFAYPTGHASVSVLYVPVGRPVKLILTSRDVIHSFFVPEFRIKQDAVPGRYTTAWFEANAPGTYQIFCTEYCGTGHSDMLGQVVALDAQDYERWLGGELDRAGRPVVGVVEGVTAPPADRVIGSPAESERVMVRRGHRAAADHGCLRCHTLDGTQHIGPTWAGLYGSMVPLTTREQVLADEAYITESIMDPLARIHLGFDPVMPSYLGRISPADTAAIVELIRSLRGVPIQGDVAPGEVTR